MKFLFIQLFVVLQKSLVKAFIFFLTKSFERLRQVRGKLCLTLIKYFFAFTTFKLKTIQIYFPVIFSFIFNAGTFQMVVVPTSTAFYQHMWVIIIPLLFTISTFPLFLDFFPLLSLGRQFLAVGFLQCISSLSLSSESQP